VITIGELRRAIELIRHRGDARQAGRLEKWLGVILKEYRDFIPDLDEDIARMWGTLRVPHHENAIDKLIAATAIINGLTFVTRNAKDFLKTGAKVLDPFVRKMD
jgi:predicted nucleic acid-binding protein